MPKEQFSPASPIFRRALSLLRFSTIKFALEGLDSYLLVAPLLIEQPSQRHPSSFEFLFVPGIGCKGRAPSCQFLHRLRGFPRRGWFLLLPIYVAGVCDRGRGHLCSFFFGF